MQRRGSLTTRSEASGDPDTSDMLYRLSSPGSSSPSAEQEIEALGVHCHIPRTPQVGELDRQVSGDRTKPSGVGAKCIDGRPGQRLSLPRFSSTHAIGAGVSKSKPVDPGEYQSDDDDTPRTAETRPPYNLKSLLAMSEGNTDAPHTTLTRNKVQFFKEWQKLHPTNKDHHKILDYKHMPYPPLHGSRRTGNDHRIVSSQSSEQFHPDSVQFGTL